MHFIIDNDLLKKFKALKYIFWISYNLIAPNNIRLDNISISYNLITANSIPLDGIQYHIIW